MTTLTFSSAPDKRHHVTARPGRVNVDGISVDVRAAGPRSFVCDIEGRSEKLQAVAHGNSIYVQLKGRAWRVDKVDPARSNGRQAADAGGASHAPMPGVVVSVQAAVGQSVKSGDPLLVIESMKLQMTIDAATDGVVAELPLGVGQTFQRGAMLASVRAGEGSPA